MRALLLASIALTLAACQSNPSATTNSAAAKTRAEVHYGQGLKRYEVDAELKRPKLTMAQTVAAKQAEATARNIERNKRLASDTAQARLHYAEQMGLFTWKYPPGEFSGKALAPREDLTIPGGNGYKLNVAGKFNRWQINARLRSISFGVLTDKSRMIVANLQPGGDYTPLKESLKAWEAALKQCRSTLPYVFGDLYLVIETTNPTVAALQVCLFEETKADSFLTAFLQGGEVLDDFVGNNGLDLQLN